MTTDDIQTLLPKNLDLDYLVTKQDDSKFGKAVTQLRALKALKKMLNDHTDNVTDVPASAIRAINTLIVQRVQLIMTEVSSMSLISIPEKDIETVNMMMTK